MLNEGLNAFLNINRPVRFEKNCVYRAKISLNYLESFVDDDYIANIFEGYGFTKVKVTGEDEARVVTGTWVKDDATVNVTDSHIITIQKLA